ncbi:EamA family transporter [Agromyces sp. H3Y2-19a]|jgi:drug/metabolite transporter (DMT)-like permease|uniref:EamA family transporter n=1 Tax=Agromyces chromiiresistens TaxID=3030835 RepID=UPI0023B9018B|nr:EamA family transporter [Agromyces chromiiresistens]MDF0512071.1 EamA family transporter [Agromyces chromiiresistens]
MIAVVALALGAALAYGVADFLGGVAARRATVFASTTVNYAVAALVLVVVVSATGGVWSLPAVTSGLIAGVLALIGFLAFFAALAAGPISLVTPVIALLSSAVPVAAALIIGDPLGPLVWVAVVAAVVGSVLIGMEHRLSVSGLSTRTVVFTLAAGLGFGFATVALDRVPDDSGLIPVLLDSVTGAVVLLAVALLAPMSAPIRRLLALLDPPAASLESAAPARESDRSPARTEDGDESPAEAGTHGLASTAMLSAAAAGLLTGIANVLLMLGLHAGNVAVVAVLTNLYPLATMALAWIVLREHLSRVQLVGALLALAASVLLGVA